jgi:galactokinase
VLTSFAPGRVNLIGEHTDHTGGLCLPMAIDLGTTVEGDVGGDRVVLRSAHDVLPAVVPLDVEDPSAVEPAWARYVAGVVAEVRPTAGFSGEVRSTLPVGAGLSSSASLTLAVAVALGADGTDPDPIAALAQRAEQRASGVPCGILDPLACAAGRAGHALLLDCSTGSHTPVLVPDGIDVVIVDSGERRALADGRYAQRRAEAIAAVEGSTDDPVLRRRARHVRTENERVLAAVEALGGHDGPALGAILLAGHRSLADDFEVSTPALDALVARLAAVPGVHGARLTGAGFGGCVVAVAEPGALTEGWHVHPVDGVSARFRRGRQQGS